MSADEQLIARLRERGQALIDTPAERPYQLVVSSVDAVAAGSLLKLAADRLEQMSKGTS